MNISPEIMNEILDFSKNSAYELRCGNSLARSNIHSTHFGIESIANIATKIWNKMPNKIKGAPLMFFKVKLKNRFHRVVLVDDKKYVVQVSFMQDRRERASFCSSIFPSWFLMKF